MGRLRDAFGVIGGGALLVAGLLAFFVVIFGSHTVCVDRTTHHVSYGSWSIDPGAWISLAKSTPFEDCEYETGAQYIVGHIPLIGDSFERAMTGPSNPAFYENR